MSSSIDCTYLMNGKQHKNSARDIKDTRIAFVLKLYSLFWKTFHCLQRGTGYSVSVQK